MLLTSPGLFDSAPDVLWPGPCCVPVVLIAKAKAASVYKGRTPTISGIEIKKLKNDGLGTTEIAKRLGIGRASVYRALGQSL
jgi:helix-turn-helix resolvase-like protein